ncbi:hypothetical protein KC644_04390 [Candidatus Berkelbacteria bacterium]|nr:hypothetical protein [Candidatus Berkelbacteria bacterium]
MSNPSAASKKLGKYEPRLKYTQRPRKGGFGCEYELEIELSLPKLVFNGSNLDELTDSHFPEILQRLKEEIRERNIWLFTRQIQEAEVRSIHYSKNIVYQDYTSCSSILNILAAADISHVYDLQKTDFRNGRVFHVHTNSLDIAIYDKIADLQRAKISDKRAEEKDNYSQLKLLETLPKQDPLSVLRFEVRLNGKDKIRRSLSCVESSYDLVFEQLYSEELAKKVLIAYWAEFFGKIRKIDLDQNTPIDLLENILREPTLTGPQQGLARLGMVIVSAESDSRHLRNLLEDRFGKNTWNRIKKLAETPHKSRYKSLIELEKQLKDFQPIRKEMFNL